MANTHAPVCKLGADWVTYTCSGGLHDGTWSTKYTEEMAEGLKDTKPLLPSHEDVHGATARIGSIKGEME